MLIDTHCHINTLVKDKFDTPLSQYEIKNAELIIQQAAQHEITHIINVGTSLIESINCITLAQHYSNCYATVGIHPNDCTSNWRNDFKEIETLVKKKEHNKIVGIGEIGLDRHYPDYNLQRQLDALKAQIELALEHDLAIVIHTRDARDETLRALEEFKKNNYRGIIHCFSEDQKFADQVIAWNFALGIGGPLTYPKNQYLRDIFTTVDLAHIVLETDTPFLPPQIIRGKKNHPLHIATIARYLADLRGITFETIAQQTTMNAFNIFRLTL